MNGPVELIREPRPEPAPAAAWPETNWWVVAPVLLVGAAVLLTLQLRWIRRRRLSDSERAYRRLASALRLPTRHRVLTRELARAHGRASPVAVLLSDRALREAASKLDAKPGSARERVLKEWMAGRGLS